MPAKGTTNNPNGRPKGIPNRTTTDFKQAVNKLIEYATPNMVAWLETVAHDDPAKALDLVHRLAEFAHPKLARTELTGKDGGVLETVSKIIIEAEDGRSED